MFDNMLKAMGIDPEQIKQMATGIGDAVRDVKQALDRIERRLDTIEDHLGIENPEPIEITHANNERTGEF